MTTDALIVKSLFQVESGIRSVARRTADTLFSFLQRTFIQHVFPVFIHMMAVLAGEPAFRMTIMEKGYRRPCLCP
jgi:hypothetical protein